MGSCPSKRSTRLDETDPSISRSSVITVCGIVYLGIQQDTDRVLHAFFQKFLKQYFCQSGDSLSDTTCFCVKHPRRYLDLIVTPGVADTFRARAAVNAAIRQTLTSQVRQMLTTQVQTGFSLARSIFARRFLHGSCKGSTLQF